MSMFIHQAGVVDGTLRLNDHVVRIHDRIVNDEYNSEGIRIHPDYISVPVAQQSAKTTETTIIISDSLLRPRSSVLEHIPPTIERINALLDHPQVIEHLRSVDQIAKSTNQIDALESWRKKLVNAAAVAGKMIFERNRPVTPDILKTDAQLRVTNEPYITGEVERLNQAIQGRAPSVLKVG